MDGAEDLGLRATESYIDDNLDYEQNLRRLRELTADEVLSLQVPVSLVVDGTMELRMLRNASDFLSLFKVLN